MLPQGHTAANGTSYEGPTEPAYDQPLDLTAYVNTSAVTVLEYFSIERAYLIFRSMGLRHLTVVDDQNRVKGIVTRKVLLYFLQIRCTPGLALPGNCNNCPPSHRRVCKELLKRILKRRRREYRRQVRSAGVLSCREGQMAQAFGESYHSARCLENARQACYPLKCSLRSLEVCRT